MNHYLKIKELVNCRMIKVPPLMYSMTIGFVVVALLQMVPCNAAVSSKATQIAVQRHNILPLNKNANTEYPESQEFQDMVSPCKPDQGGYFGGTSGDSATIQYGFELESPMNMDISNALYVIREQLMDSIVSITFPSVCSSRELSVTNQAMKDSIGITGFDFGDDFDAAQSCIPQLTIHNDCTIFTGSLSVFGTSLTVVSMQQFLDSVVKLLPIFPVDGLGSKQNVSSAITSSLISYGVNRLSASQRYTQLIRIPRKGPIDITDTTVMPIGVKIGLLLLVLLTTAILVVSIRSVLLVRHQQRVMLQAEHPSKKEPFSENDQSLLSKFWIIFNTTSGQTSCDSTHSSLSAASGPSFINFPSKQRSSPTCTKRPSVHSTHLMQFSSVEPESIYIVEPDDDDNAFWHPAHSFRSGFMEDMDFTVVKDDPLSRRDSFGGTKEYEFELH